MKDFAVVGSGVGGSSIAALLNAKGYDVALFEKEPYLGGCSSTFIHKGYKYNSGATTLAGYAEGYIVKEIFDAIGFTPKLIQTDPSIVIIQNDKITPRYKNFEQFFAVVTINYPHTKNKEFWELVYTINKEFYDVKNYYYSNQNIFKKLKSLLSFVPLTLKFQKYLKVNAHSYIQKLFGNISKDYLQFLESQILIVAQASMKEINFLTAILALGYTFNENHYVIGGFGALFDDLTQNINAIHRNSEITKIVQQKDFFELYTKDEIFKAKKVILNTTVYDSANLFPQMNIKKYYKKYEKLNNYQSSFMVYMTIKSNKEFSHHYQIIQNKVIKNTLSQALFVSFSDENDTKIVPKGCYSITVSIHTDSRFWENEATYKMQKKELEATLQNIILEKLSIDKGEIIEIFSATSKTFQNYINRSQLGGNAITMKNFLPFLPANDTPIKNLYNVGDTVYAAQGWPGVMLGVKNLKRLLGV